LILTVHPTSTMAEFPFPNGQHNKLCILHLDSLTDVLVNGALSLISNNGYHYTSSNAKKHIVVPNKGCVNATKRTHSIRLESLFKEALRSNGCDNPEYRDYYRYQTHPDDCDELLRCPEIKDIIDRVQVSINQQVQGYVAYKISVLYSLPGGEQQGFHQDDARSEAVIAEEGAMLSVIVALQDNTKLDVRNASFERKTLSISKGLMFVFDGRLVHGGAAYTVHNVRLHIYFRKMVENVVSSMDKGKFENVIAPTYRCPVEDCPKKIGNCNLTLSQMRNHWRMKHAPVENMGWKRYHADKEGKLHKCDQCHETFLNFEGLKKHVTMAHKPKRKRRSDSK